MAELIQIVKDNRERFLDKDGKPSKVMIELFSVARGTDIGKKKYIIEKIDKKKTIKDIMNMTAESFKKEINNKKPKMKNVETTVDFGKPKKQGKRIGGGMIIGSMSNAPEGKKTYYSRIPDYPEWKEEKIWKTSANPELYSQAREFGLSHKESVKYAILSDRYHKYIVENALKNGENVSDLVLNDYPDLKEKNVRGEDKQKRKERSDKGETRKIDPEDYLNPNSENYAYKDTGYIPGNLLP